MKGHRTINRVTERQGPFIGHVLYCECECGWRGQNMELHIVAMQVTDEVFIAPRHGDYVIEELPG